MARKREGGSKLFSRDRKSSSSSIKKYNIDRTLIQLSLGSTLAIRGFVEVAVRPIGGFGATERERRGGSYFVLA